MRVRRKKTLKAMARTHMQCRTFRTPTCSVKPFGAHHGHVHHHYVSPLAGMRTRSPHPEGARSASRDTVAILGWSYSLGVSLLLFECLGCIYVISLPKWQEVVP